MKKSFTINFLYVVLATFISIPAWSQNITTPRAPSPAATVSQTVGISKVSVEYSRPSVKGRDIWGALVPYGWNVQQFGNQKSAPWRAGANENTVIEFSHDAKVEGKAVPAGRYGLFFVINKDNSGEVILSKDSRSWGSFFYEQSQDQLRANIQLRTIPITELLTYDFISLDKNSTELVLNWEKKQFPIRIEFAVDDIVMANAAEELKSTAGFSWQGYASAANYALQNNLNLEQGLQWADRAVVMNKSFTTLMAKANILETLDRVDEAKPIKTEAMKMGTEAELNAYGYQLVNMGKFDEAIHIMKVNTENHPESANAWDSLGEVYALKGDKENAIKSFNKSLSLNPPANVRANSEKYLKQFGVKVP
jgi:tetratricopeptide (TPR) repeat protein